jgi:hypothetical protein
LRIENRYPDYFRAFRGRAMILTIRVNTGQNRTDDFEHGFHSNDTWGHIRRFIHNRYLINLCFFLSTSYFLDINLLMVLLNYIVIMKLFIQLMIIKH